MPRSRSFQFVLIIAVGVLVECGCLWAMRARYTTDFSAAARRLDADFNAGIEAISAAYSSGNAVAHARESATMLRLTNRASIRALLPQVDRLIKEISADGLAPYQSIAIEVAYRLGRINQQTTRDKFNALARVALAPQQTNHVRAPGKSRMLGLVRDAGIGSYRQFDADTTYAVGLLMFSEFGRSQFVQGQTPYDLARTAAMFWNCQREEKEVPRRDDAAQKLCRDFVEHLSKTFADAGQGNLLPVALNGLDNGSQMHTFTCAPSEQSAQNLVESVEAYTACMNSRDRTPAGARVDGASVTSDSTGSPPNFPGYTHVRSREYVKVGPNGDRMTQVAHEYVNGTGGTATVTNYRGTVGGQETSGTSIYTDDGAGSQHQQHADSQGQVTSSFTQNADGSTYSYQRTSDGSTYSVTSHSDGTTYVEVTDPQGQVTRATIEENGKCEGTACNATMPNPADETGGCRVRPIDSRNSPRAPTTDPLGPYIYPDPDSAPRSPLLACVVQSVGTGSTAPRCPPSVVFCLDPPPLGSCGCGKPSHGAPPDPRRGVCSQIQCGDGATCDPSMGVCRAYAPSGQLGAFSPGAKPLPRPSIRLPFP